MSTFIQSFIPRSFPSLDQQKEAGRTKDPRNILHVDEKEEDDDIELSYKDEFGREMTKKEAFRSLSHTFHGRKPGKKKQELVRISWNFPRK